MQKPENQPSSAVLKAIAALKEQKEMTQRRYEAAKMDQGALKKELATTQSKYLADIAKAENQMATAERELEEIKAAIAKLEGLGG